METMNCKSCPPGKADHPVSEMFVRGGKPIRTCRVCKSGQMAGNGGNNRIAKLADKVSKAKVGRPKKAKADKVVDVPAFPARLAIAAGFGVEAEIDAGNLKLDQRDVEGNIVDTVVLTRAELRQVIQTYGHWAA